MITKSRTITLFSGKISVQFALFLKHLHGRSHRSRQISTLEGSLSLLVSQISPFAPIEKFKRLQADKIEQTITHCVTIIIMMR